MQKAIFTVFVAMMMLPPAYADEEIQLAAVMVESGYSATDADKLIYAAPYNQTGGGSSYVPREPDFEYAVISGIVVGGMLAIIADGLDSTSNH